MPKKTITVYTESRYSQSEIAEVYSGEIGWDEDDARWGDLAAYLQEEIPIQFEVDTDTGSLRRL